MRVCPSAPAIGWWLRLATGSGGLAISACFPALTHGPRIENGVGVGGTLSLSGGTRYTEGDERARILRFGHVGGHVSYGKAAKSPQLPRLHASLAVPLTFLAQLDVFVQAPPAWTGPLSAGFGVNAGEERVDRYAQIGHIRDNGNGWFLTQGFSRRTMPSGIASPTVSVSGAAMQYTRGARRHYVFVQYGTGLIPSRCSDRCASSPREHSVAAGLTVERRLRTERKP